jgi:hypothetical protein
MPVVQYCTVQGQGGRVLKLPCTKTLCFVSFCFVTLERKRSSLSDVRLQSRSGIDGTVQEITIVLPCRLFFLLSEFARIKKFFSRVIDDVITRHDQFGHSPVLPGRVKQSRIKSGPAKRPHSRVRSVKENDLVNLSKTPYG